MLLRIARVLNCMNYFCNFLFSVFGPWLTTGELKPWKAKPGTRQGLLCEQTRFMFFGLLTYSSAGPRGCRGKGAPVSPGREQGRFLCLCLLRTQPGQRGGRPGGRAPGARAPGRRGVGGTSPVSWIRWLPPSPRAGFT